MRFLSLLLLCFLSVAISATPIDTLTARETAARFLQTLAGQRPTTKSIHVAARRLSLRTSTLAAHLFTATDGRFVLTAADDRLPEVLGYGENGGEKMPLALSELLNLYTRLLKQTSVSLTASGGDGGTPVAPLLTAVRHQKAPYNNYCPYYTDDDGTVSNERCVVGCVATAMEEVVSYYKRVVTLRDTLYGWQTTHYTIPDILPSASVDTRLIRANYDTIGTYTEAEADAVARLSYYLGVAAHMSYGLDSSGANVYRLEEPLRRAFGFGYVHYIDSYRYRPADWLAMLYAELRNGRPVFYAGSAMRLNGHAFVLDGLDADGLFHVNWGVDGDYDGYFRLDLLNASEPAWDITETGQMQGFFCNQEAILLHPDSLTVALPDTLARTGTEIVVDSIRFDLQPVSNRITPVHLYLRNTAAYALTTPFEVFLNAPTDTAYFAQGEYIGLTGATLAAGEVRDVTMMALLPAAGSWTLRVSPDDIHILCEVLVTVEAEQASELTFATPVIDFPEDGLLRVQQQITNADTGGRAGGKVTYELFEGEPRYDHNGTAHAKYCFLGTGETATDTVFFRNLTPDADYTLYVRYPWTVVQEVRFTCPSPTSITVPTLQPAAAPIFYDLSGRRVRRPTTHGILVGSDGQKVMH